jgi:hypothetical protein
LQGASGGDADLGLRCFKDCKSSSGFDDAAMLGPAHFCERIGHTPELVETSQAELRSGETLRETLARVEAWLLRPALEANQNQRTRTARQLGITREGLYKKRPTLTGIARSCETGDLRGSARSTATPASALGHSKLRELASSQHIGDGGRYASPSDISIQESSELCATGVYTSREQIQALDIGTKEES